MRAMARTMARKNDQGRPRWELSEILRSPTAHVLAAIGVIGLAAILYLMVFQPH